MGIGAGIKTIEFMNNKIRIIDQRKLPDRLQYIDLSTKKQVCDAIKTLAVRGAPAIGVCAAYGLYISICKKSYKDRKIFFKQLNKNAKLMISSRPTAVNLSWAVKRLMQKAIDNKQSGIADIKKILFAEAEKIHKQDQDMCIRMGKFGAKLIRHRDSILTHCNAGALATSGIGTALAPMYIAKSEAKKIKVYADETRPLLQGARITAWELKKAGIDVTLICDNMAASLMHSKKINKIMVGADRIAANGDFANKIGTYSLAVLAKVHNIPFYVVAPTSTFDFNLKTGSQIPIEQRDPDEVRKIKTVYTADKNVNVYNPAFDVTPHYLVTAFVTDKGIFRKPNRRSLKSLKS